VKTALRVVAGAALLVLVVWYVDPRTILRSLAGVNPWLFGCAVAVSILSNVFSALRWSAILRSLNLQATLPQALLMYARAVTANMMLPGSVVSGDVLRSYQLSRIGPNPLAASAWSVFLDRFSGLWILCAMSALAAAVAVLGYAGVAPDQAFAVGLLYGLAAVVQGILAAPLFLAKA
jgi:uncharacterized protein (TIRG00374 family)